MRVKTTAAHSNEYGDKHDKVKGDEYDCPDLVGQSLIANKLVSEIKPTDLAKA